MTIRGQGVYENNGLDLVNRRVKKRFVKRSISDFSINITIAPLIDKKVLEVKYNLWLYRFCCKIILQILDKLIIYTLLPTVLRIGSKNRSRKNRKWNGTGCEIAKWSYKVAPANRRNFYFSTIY